MDNQKFTNRAVDKLPTKKGKEYLWKYIQSKVDMKKKVVREGAQVEEGARSVFTNFLKSLFKMPVRLASVSVVAVLVIVALVFSSTLGDWLPGAIKPETVHAAFEMVAETQDSSGITNDSGFILTASEDLSEKTIQENLKIDPVVDFKVDKVSESKYEIQPEQALEGNKIYSFSIKTADKEYSWAYQVQDTFKVTGTLPDNKSTSVPINTGIEISFSHENFDFENAENFLEIFPKVKGTFEHHNRILVFVPNDSLKEATIYTVTMKKGFKLNGSDKKLAEDYVFQFETDGGGNLYNEHFNFSKDYYEIGVKNTIALEAYGLKLDEGEKNDIQVQVYKYKDLNQYLDALDKSLQIPEWAYYSRELHKYATGNLENVGTFQALTDKTGWKRYIYLPNEVFEAGYYVFQLESDGKVEQAIVQVTDLSGYMSVSLTDSLIWVNDLATGKPVNGATVELGKTGLTYKTGEDGVARFKTPDEWKRNYDDVAFTFIKITAPDGKVLINKFATYADESYASYNYWQSFSTDRPIYKPTDTVQFWGFISPKNSNGKLDNLNLQLHYEWNTFVKDVPIKMDKDGIFEGKVEIENFTPGYYYLALYSGKNRIIANGFEVADYIKPAYNLTIEADKHAVFAGEKMNFNVKSIFFDGTPMPNLQLTEDDPSTDAKGEAKISVKAGPAGNCASNDYCYDIHNFYYSVSPKSAEETDIQASVNVRIFDSHMNIGTIGEVKEEDGKTIGEVKIKTNWIDLSRINNEIEKSYSDYLGEVASYRSVTGKITEVTWKKTETGQYYDFINKKTEKTYEYARQENNIGEFAVVTDENGEAKHSFPIDPKKYYVVSLSGADDQGNNAHASEMVYGSLSRSAEYEYYQMKILNGEKYDNPDTWWEEENSYRFEIGDSVEMAIANGEVVLDKNTKGEFLFMEESNGLQSYEVKNSPYYSFEFEKDDVPNVYVEGIWFTGKQYQRAYFTSAEYDTELEKLNIEIESDEKQYNPGDEVTLSVKVTDQNGSPAKAKVNLNLVDEAYYKIAYDNFVDPLNEIYTANAQGILFSYDTHNNPLQSAFDGGGKGGCFTGDTQILMSDGTTKAIKDIKKGDFILTRESEYSARLIAVEVTGKMEKYVSEYLVINDYLKVTGEHIVFANGKWERVDNLRVGDSLLDKDGNEVRIFSIRKAVDPVWVYNIEIKGKHTYLANGFYVHNQKGGDSIRQDFKDTALFEVISTGADGRGELTFKLPDNITSWRVVAKAIDPDNLRAGAKIEKLKVSLPFFADLILNKEYSVKDKPIIKFRAYGEALKDGDKVGFKVNVDEATGAVTGKAFDGNYYNLPDFGNLGLGQHDVTVKAESGKLSDGLKKPFEIKGSRLKKDVVNLVRDITDKTVFELGKVGPTEIKFVDGGVAYFYSDLWSLLYDDGDRLDQRVSRIAASELLKKYFGEEVVIDNEGLIAGYQRNLGLSLLPYSSADLRLSALISSFDSDPDRYNIRDLKDYFYSFYKNSKSNLDEVVLSLLGLSSMKEPVLLSLREIQNEEKLTVEEKLYIALAFENLGSNGDARKIYEEVLGDLMDDDDYKGVYNAALGAVLAAGLGEGKQAESLWEFVRLYGFGNEDVINLYELGYVRNSLKYANFEPVKFALKINNHEETVELENGEGKSIMVFPKDNVAVSVKKGELAAVLHYEESVSPEQFKKDSRIGITRKYYVNGKETTELTEGDIVQVVMSLSYAKGIFSHPYFKITDITPSGLKPMSNYAGFRYFDTGISYPYFMNGQEISFVWYPEYNHGYKEIVPGAVTRNEIKYFARVVNPGEFYADPAKIELFDNSNVANISESVMIKIKPITQ